MQVNFDSAYRNHVFIYKRSIKLPLWGVVSGTQSHVTGHGS